MHTRLAIALCLVLTLLGVELPVVHAHAAKTPGYYNEECPLDRLALGPGAATLSAAAPDAPSAPPAVPATPAVSPTACTRPPLALRARAPPSAS